MDLPEFLLQHTVTVEPWLGKNGYGADIWGPGVAIACFVEDKRRLVRAKDGSEVVSETTVYANRGPQIPARSRVTLPSGRKPLVIVVSDHDGGTLPVPSHLEIACE
jgi:hypothetical protein